jgi:type II secretory pathway predicted ATPase ExeA
LNTGLYTDVYGFTERPFTLLPDPDFLFWSAAHKRASAVLEYGILTHAPLTVITGEVGTGKTTLLQNLLKSMDENSTVGLLSNAHGGRGELLRWLLNALEVPHDAKADYVELFQALQDFIIEEYASGRHVIVVIDEAQNLSIEGLEELRMLTNINSNKDDLLQLILVGQPELRDIIALPELRQFAQRVTATYHIEPFNWEMTHKYIIHRLRHVGGTGNEFTKNAMDAIYCETGGVPRLINKLCDLLLVYASQSDDRVVREALVKELVSDGLFLNTQKPPPLFLRNNIAGSQKVAE